MMLAVRYSSIEVVKTLIGRGADVNAKNNKGQTVLSIAEKSRDNIVQPDILMILRSAGAKP